jgi:cytochrome c oxidase subunit 2
MKLFKRTFITIFLLVVLTSCSMPVNWVTNPGSSITSQQSNLYLIILIPAAVVFLIVEGGIILSVIRFRRRKGDTTEPKQTHGNIPLEIIWTVLPVLLVIFIFIFALHTMNGIAAPAPSANELKVNVVGHQWWWEFDYQDLKITTADELYIPVGTPVQITLTSVDVIHSFWVPQLAGKTDVVPGQTNHMWITASQTGTYDGQCSEFCGIEHALMRAKVIVVSQADFQAWVKQQQTPPPAPQTALEIQGQKLVETGVCAACHTIDGSPAKGTVGPNLTHLYSRGSFAGASFPLTDANIADWLQNAKTMKPGNDMSNIHVSNQDLPAIMAFLKTLK